jgi:hypothetical protein
MTTSSPLFSICIPSRDRLKAVKQTVGSVMGQSFENWEIIISDNSTSSHGAISDWVKTLDVPQNKIRVVETGGTLQMDANWEAATRPATGDYVLVVADRWRLRNGALKVFADIVEQYDPDLFFWPGTKFGQLEAMLSRPSGPPPIQVSQLSANEVLGEFLNFRGFKTESVYGQPIPRALNSAYRRCLGDQARNIWGELFRPVSPDYTSAMALLLLGDRCIKIHEMMYTPLLGTGSNFSTSSIIGLGHYLKSYPGCHVWRGLDKDIVFSTVLNDVESTLKVTQEGHAWTKRMNIKNALKCMMSELNFKEFNGSLLPVQEMRNAIYTLASREGLSVAEIDDIKNYVDRTQHRWVQPRRLLRWLGLYDWVRALNDKLRHGRRKAGNAQLLENEDTAKRGLQLVAEPR